MEEYAPRRTIIYREREDEQEEQKSMEYDDNTYEEHTSYEKTYEEEDKSKEKVKQHELYNLQYHSYENEATNSRLDTRITLAKSVSLLKSEVRNTLEPMSIVH